MYVVRMNDVPKTPQVCTLFTSKEITVQQLIPEGGDYNMNVVNFGRSVRNKFHVHESDQILIVTALNPIYPHAPLLLQEKKGESSNGQKTNL